VPKPLNNLLKDTRNNIEEAGFIVRVLKSIHRKESDRKARTWMKMIRRAQIKAIALNVAQMVAFRANNDG